VWTLKAQGKHRVGKTVDTIEALPTMTHMSLVDLQNRGILKYLVSQNCDGIHRRSGMRPQNISELHGNGNMEECETCGYKYFRDFHAYRLSRGRDHYTGRHCVRMNTDGKTCNGRLLEYTIDFGQNLPVEPLRLAKVHSKKADLHLVLGSSLTVSPACNMPEATADKGGKLVICNLQRTPLDAKAFMIIHAKTDTVMTEVMKRLGFEIPNWKLYRRVRVSSKPIEANSYKLLIEGVDPEEEMPASVIKNMKIKTQFVRVIKFDKEPFTFDLINTTSSDHNGTLLEITLNFMGHYEEPPFIIYHKITNSVNVVNHRLTFLPMVGKWSETTDAPSVPETMVSDAAVSIGVFNTQPEKAWSFKKLNAGGDIPDSTTWPAAVCVQFYEQRANVKRDIMLLIGGTSSSKYIPAYDPLFNKWTKIPLDHGDSVFPRWGLSASVIEDDSSVLVYLIGGWDSRSQYNDVNIFNFSKFELTPVTISGDRPQHRSCHSAVVKGDNIIIFGGSYCNGGPYHYFNDIWVLDTKRKEWKQLTTTGEVPEARSQHSATIVKNSMIIIGGSNATTHFNDTYALSLDTLVWTKIATTGECWATTKLAPSDFRVSAIRHSAIFYDHYIIVNSKFGTSALDLDTMKWKNIYFSEDPKRSVHACALIKDRIFLVGGSNGDNESSDIMALELH